jgi:hypothetical protein
MSSMQDVDLLKYELKLIGETMPYDDMTLDQLDSADVQLRIFEGFMARLDKEQFSQLFISYAEERRMKDVLNITQDTQSDINFRIRNMDSNMMVQYFIYNSLEESYQRYLIAKGLGRE